MNIFIYIITHISEVSEDTWGEMVLFIYKKKEVLTSLLMFFRGSVHISSLATSCNR